MIDHYEIFFAGYMPHKEQHQISIEHKNHNPSVLKQSTDYVHLCDAAITLLQKARNNICITIK